MYVKCVAFIVHYFVSYFVLISCRIKILVKMGTFFLALFVISGTVIGISGIDQQAEVDLRQMMHRFFKRMTPTVPTTSYRIDFVNVYHLSTDELIGNTRIRLVLFDSPYVRMHVYLQNGVYSFDFSCCIIINYITLVFFLLFLHSDVKIRLTL